MTPIEFTITTVPEKVYRRYARYNTWWRYHPAMIVLCIVVVTASVAFLVIDDIRSEDTFFSSGYIWLVWAIVMLAMIPNGLYERNRRPMRPW